MTAERRDDGNGTSLHEEEKPYHLEAASRRDGMHAVRAPVWSTGSRGQSDPRRSVVQRPPELHPFTFPAAVASRDLFERALQCPEDGGLTDLIVGRQGRHGLACRIALGDLALTEARPIPSVLAIWDVLYPVGEGRKRSL